MRIMLKKRIYLIFTLFLSLFLLTNYSLARAQDKDKILSLSDVKIYKKIFEIQKKQIKNKKSKEWKDVDRLISKLKNKILLGNVYADRYLHPTGWRSSYNELRLWLKQYNDHPDATRISRIAVKRKPKNLKILKNQHQVF
jgi:hypothetical protein